MRILALILVAVFALTLVAFFAIMTLVSCSAISTAFHERTASTIVLAVLVPLACLYLIYDVACRVIEAIRQVWGRI